MRKIADWQLRVSEPYFDRIWTWSALYVGLIAASDSLNDPKYLHAVEAMGRRYEWEERSHMPDADDLSLAQAYINIYVRTKDPAMLKPTQGQMDALLASPRAAATPGHSIEWWWSDALFMAPPVWAQMYAITGDRKYLTYLDRQWAKTADSLYIVPDRLFARDATYLTRTEANGKPMYWARGNGWVMAGIIRTIDYMPKDDPMRARMIDIIRQMASRVAELQGPDGLWRAGLLDADSYDQPENSGSAFFAYAIAGGINRGILDRKTYEPVVKRAWAGLLRHVYADGRLGCIQQTGAEPAPFKASASYTYGVGAFLLAGSEIRAMSSSPKH
jgi:rhamnogalacturonyl hydrolase YesR